MKDRFKEKTLTARKVIRRLVITLKYTGTDRWVAKRERRGWMDGWISSRKVVKMERRGWYKNI